MPRGNGNFLIVGGQRNELTQFHFHHPSEEYFHGKPSDMVAHLMRQGSDGKVAAVAVLLKAGSANSTVDQLWEHIPKTPGKEEVIAGVEVNPAGLLPRDTSYYTYMGSLTAPPCSESVTWFVAEDCGGHLGNGCRTFPADRCWSALGRIRQRAP
jgi:carbonic anhydrase